MVQVWRSEALAPATIQTYLSFLRGLASWLGKPGLVRQPEAYGLRPEEFERHEGAQCDKSWSGKGIGAEALLASASAKDVRVGTSMRLMLPAPQGVGDVPAARPCVSVCRDWPGPRGPGG